MTGEEEARDRPVVRVFVGRRPGRYRAEGDVSGASMPSVRDGGVVRVSVGVGLRPQDIPTAALFAQSVRNAAVVEIVGGSRQAVDHARRVFLAAWDVELPAAGEGSVSRWAALMLAQTRDDGMGAAR
ncbi:hypothetical protein [Streptomyces mirabilis]|uniref:Uncharacterized protein n=1 Tax=Streptomyces mirabilis TaxID=68239 RepID=A0ABU3UW90_9ACTN|nr:hypothetical protein [Streptomyces mirabilis]MDU8998203.1 hypothetical protein [Streptomyces mirabilis]